MGEQMYSPDEIDTVLSSLTYRHSQAVCNYFRSYSTDSASVDELVQFTLEQGDGDTDEQRVEIYLHHATLPKLVDAGFIDFDPRSKTVRYRDPEFVESWVDHVVEEGGVSK